uniref:Uncharacterized protein n=1 Tax=Anguilla anguilla TaxID=7936 RepID=A0A0E9UD92_ANGAN
MQSVRLPHTTNSSVS